MNRTQMSELDVVNIWDQTVNTSAVFYHCSCLTHTPLEQLLAFIVIAQYDFHFQYPYFVHL